MIRSPFYVAILILLIFALDTNLAEEYDQVDSDFTNSQSADQEYFVSDSKTQRESAKEPEPLRDHHSAIFLGMTSHHGNTSFTIGANYEYPVLAKLGLFVFFDYAFADPNTFTLGGGIILHLSRGLKLVATPGLELSDGFSNTLFRAGVAYDLFFGHFSFTPTLNVNFIENGSVAYVYGLGFGIAF